MKKNISKPGAAIKPKAKAQREFQPVFNKSLLRTLSIIVFAFGIILYAQTSSYEFTLDDYSAIKENRVTRQGISALGTIFKTSYRYGYTIQGDELYRPVPKSIYAILWSMSPDNPKPGHLLNIFFYACTGLLMFLVLVRYLNNLYIPFFTALIFLSHPVHTEVAASIKSMDEMLGLFFFLVSLLAIHKYITGDNVIYALLAGVSYMAALMSKESAITFVAIVPVAILFFTKASNKQNMMASGIMLGVALLFLLIRYSVLKDSGAGPPAVADNSLMAAKDFATKKASAIFIMGLYLKTLIVPHPLFFDASVNQIPLVSAGDWKFILSLLVYGAIIAYAIINFKNKDVIAFGILFFLVAASLSSNVFMTIGTHYGERLLYAPSFGFCLAIAALISKFINPNNEPDYSLNTLGSFVSKRPLAVATVGIISLAFSYKTFAQNPVWKNNLSLYEHGVKAAPNSTRTHYYLGNYITKEDYWKTLTPEKKDQEIKRGIDELKKSLEIYNFSESYLSLGVIYYRLNKMDSAMYFYNKAIEIAPYIATIHNNVGTVYFETQQYQKALQAFQKAVELDPNYAEAFCNLGSAYGTLGQLDNAISNFSKAIQLDPNNAMANYFMGITLQNQGKKFDAQPYLDKAAQLEPGTYKR